MLQKLKVTSYALIILLLLVLPSQAAAQDNMGVCEPVEHIKAMKDGPRNHDYILWVDRCQVTGSKGQCGNKTEWPVGNGGRCQTTAADTVAAQDGHATVPPVNVTPVVTVQEQAIADCKAAVARDAGDRSFDKSHWPTRGSSYARPYEREENRLMRQCVKVNNCPYAYHCVGHDRSSKGRR